ncbi:GLPGLI family protein [Chryseobacterium sp. A301]
MRKLMLSLLVTVSFLGSAQSMRFVYEARMVPNLEKPDQVVVENVLLDVGEGQSVFQSENSVKRDSLIQRVRVTGTMEASQFRDLNSKINYVVKKNLKDQVTTYQERIGRDQYAYQEDRKMAWEIQDETTKVGDYSAQKATVDFGGRKWTAWFTTEIPFADGPYKFSGLPGLIVKVEDESGEYSFDLKESKALNVSAANSADTSGFGRGRLINLKRSDFEKQKARFRKDPVAFMAAASGPGRGQGRGGMDPSRQKEIQNRLLTEIKDSSNGIEK